MEGTSGTTPELVEVAAVIATIQQSAQEVAMCSGKLLSFVRALVTKVIGADPRPSEVQPEPEKSPLEPGLVGLTQAHLSVIRGNIEAVSSELQRL